MYSILEEFFYGNVPPRAQAFCKDPRYDELLCVITGLETKLRKGLNDEEKELLEKLMDAQLERSALVAIKSQVYGYKLGLQMTAEAFVTGKELMAWA